MLRCHAPADVVIAVVVDLLTLQYGCVEVSDVREAALYDLHVFVLLVVFTPDGLLHAFSAHTAAAAAAAGSM